MTDEIKKMLELEPQRLYNPNDKNDIVPQVAYLAKDVKPIIRGFLKLMEQQETLIALSGATTTPNGKPVVDVFNAELLKAMVVDGE